MFCLSRKSLIVGAIIAAVAAVSPAHAFSLFGKWATNNITLRLSSTGFPAGPWRDSIDVVRSRYFSNPSKAWISHIYNDTSVALGNGQSEVWWSSSISAPGITYWWTSGGFIVEADVVFRNTDPYTTSMNKLSLWAYGGASRPFQTTAMHEYGHVLGLGHEDDRYNIMGQDWTHLHLNGSLCRSYVGEDACNGLVVNYGAVGGTGFQDVSVVHWKFLAASGAYSSHQLTKMYNSAAIELPWTNFNGQRRYNVNKGQTVQVEFSYENNGQSSQTPSNAIYLSTDANITTTDTLLQSFSLFVSRDTVLVHKRTITIPTWLVSGQTYYIGAIVDRTGAIAETDESNNAAYHIVRVN